MNSVFHFRPTQEPARAIYDALVAEQENRQKTGYPDWIAKERRVVLDTAASMARLMGLREPTLHEVEIAEQCATGHIDYSKKFAYGVADAMKRGTP